MVAGHDRRELGLLVFANVPACRALSGLGDGATEAQVLAHPRVREALTEGLERHNAHNPGSSTRFARALVLVEPPSIDANEITDKGYINQRAVLSRRSDDVEALFSDAPAVLAPR